MKKLALLLAALLLCGGCTGDPHSAGEEQLDILATTYPVYLFATALTEGAQGVQVSRLNTGEVACLHDYTLTVGDMKALERADVIAMNGAGLESFLTHALEGSDAPVIDCAAGFELLETCHSHEEQDHDRGHDHSHEADPHLWLCAAGARAMLENLCEGLCALDGEQAKLYEANLAAALKALDEGLHRPESVERPWLVTFHDGFAYLAAEQGLEILFAMEEEQGSTASAAQIRHVTQLMKEHGVTALFTETNSSTATARAVARETGAAVYNLDTLMSGDGQGMESYIDAMNANLDEIARALGGG